jgi:hypothetical protein
MIMPTLMFQDRFAPKVESGEKRHTIRPPRKHPIKAGDILYLKAWTGLPYRSKTRALRKPVICLLVRKVSIGIDGKSRSYLALGGRRLSRGAWDDMARLDGFSGYREMLIWFIKTHGLPFEGVLYEW